MKKSSIFALILLVGGIACCIAGVAMGATSGQGISLRVFQYQEQAQECGLEVNQDINKLVIDLDAADLTVQVGDSWQLFGGRSLTWNVERQTVTIEQENEPGWWYRSHPAPITLIVPRDCLLSTLDVEIGAGTAEISQITADSIECSVNAGSLNMRDIDTNRLDADVDTGSMDLFGCVRGMDANETAVNLECDAGQIVLQLTEGSGIGHVSGKVNMGQIEIYADDEAVLNEAGLARMFGCDIPHATGTSPMNIDCDMGSIYVSIATGSPADAA